MDKKEQYIYKDGRYIKISSFGGGGANVQIVEALPDQGTENTIYLVKNEPQPGPEPTPGSTVPLIKITWAELKALRDNSELIPGMQYQITDYECTTIQEDTKSADHRFDIIVVADSKNTLNEQARATYHYQKETLHRFIDGITIANIKCYYKIIYESESDYSSATSFGWLDSRKNIVSIDNNNGHPQINTYNAVRDVNDTFNYIGTMTIDDTVYDKWLAEDSGGSEEHPTYYLTNIIVEEFDGDRDVPDGYFLKETVGVVSANWINGEEPDPSNVEVISIYGSQEEEPYIELTQATFKQNKNGVTVPAFKGTSIDDDQSESYYIYDGEAEEHEYVNTLVSVQYCIDEDGEEFTYPDDDGHYKPEDFFCDLGYIDVDGVQTPILYKSDSEYYFDEGPDYMDTFIYIGDFELDGVTYNRWTKTYGSIDDPQINFTLLTQVIVENNQFTITRDELIDAIEEASLYLNKWSEYRTDKGGFTGSYITTNTLVEKNIGTILTPVENLSKWQLWYCLDNDPKRFAWAAFQESENGKGVIYKLIDDSNNEAPYDFKNIQFKTYDAYGQQSSNYYYTFGSNTKNNKIGKYLINTSSSNPKESIGRNCISASSNNTIQEGCCDVRIIDHGGNNTIESGCYSIEIDSSGGNNIFGSNCSRCWCGGSNNITGKGCSSITYGLNAKNNNIGSNNANLTIDGKFNTTGDDCNHFTIETYSENNYFGRGCRNIKAGSFKNCKFGNSCSYINFTYTYGGNTRDADLVNVTVNDTCYYINIHNDSANGEQRIMDVEIANIWGNYNSYITINHSSPAFTDRHLIRYVKNADVTVVLNNN